MRQVLSWRFVAAIARRSRPGVRRQFVFASQDDGRRDRRSTTEPDERRADVVALVARSSRSTTSRWPRGQQRRRAVTMVIDDVGRSRSTDLPRDAGQVDVSPASAGRPVRRARPSCSATPSSLPLVPLGPQLHVPAPGDRRLDGGSANLVNGWQVPYAAVIDRSAAITGRVVRRVPPSQSHPPLPSTPSARTRSSSVLC